MATTDKKRKAQEDQERLRKASTAAHFKLSAKNAAAKEAQEDRWARERERMIEQGCYKPLSCVCEIDRVVLAVKELNIDSLRGIPGYRFQKKRYLGKKSRYRRAQPIKGTGSIKKIVVEYDRRSWAPAYRLTIEPTDTGLAPADLQSILELLPDFKFSLIEVAWDFPGDSAVDVAYVRRFMLSGKLWLEPGTHPYHFKCGNPKGSMIVKCYIKWELGGCRIELQLQPRFVRQHRINDIFDFQRLVEVLVPGHIHFSELDQAKLVAQLQRRGFSDQRMQNVLDMTEDLGDSLWAALRYLRKKGLTNVQRLCTPLDGTNRVIRKALVKLLATWPKGPARLES